MSQKYALITGASSGIGYAMSAALSKRGYQVFGCAPAFAMKGMEPLAKEYGVIGFPCDISNVEDIKKAVKLVGDKTGGRLDILYNNAGIAIGGPCFEYDEQELDKIFQINVIGHINMTKHFADMVIAAQGTIVFTSSIAGFMPLSWTGAYSATKAAINAYAKTLHMEMAPFGVKVYSVITGGVNTNIGDSSGDVDEILAQKQIEGSHFDVDGIIPSVKHAQTMTKRFSEDPAVYAEGIANKITKKKNYGFNLYKGKRAVFSYFLHLLVPLWLLQRCVAFEFKQLVVFRNIRKRMKQLQG